MLFAFAVAVACVTCICVALVVTGVVTPSPKLVVVVSVAFAMGFIPALFQLRRVAVFRARGLVSAMMRLASRDFSARLASPPAAELVIVQEGFHAMAEAIADADRAIRESDARRRRLFADLSHELATPTSAIMGIADTLAQPGLVTDESQRKRWIDAIADEAQLLARLIADVRDLAALEDPDVSVLREEHAWRPLIERVVRAWPSQREPSLTFRSHVDDEVMVSCDPARIAQVVRNLLSNAQRHTPKQGSVSIEVHRDESQALLVVEDTGSGVDDALLSRLGERLFRADPSRDRRTGGHGMGLAIVRGIIARHDGAVRFARAASGGLRVEVRLPLVTREVNASGSPAR